MEKKDNGSGGAILGEKGEVKQEKDKIGGKTAGGQDKTLVGERGWTSSRQVYVDNE